MDESPLGLLAPEVRNQVWKPSMNPKFFTEYMQIYRYVLTTPQPLCSRFSIKDDTWCIDASYQRPNLLAVSEASYCDHE